jgi:hypothetical protein
MKPVDDIVTWRTLAIVAGLALIVVLVTVTVTSVYKSSVVKTAYIDRFVTDNATSVIPHLAVEHLITTTQCFDDYQYCTGFDTEHQCIANGGDTCVNNLNVFGSLLFKDGGGFGNTTAFDGISIGELTCTRGDDNDVHCSGATLFPDNIGLPVTFDPDHFASITRDGQTFVISAETLRLAALIVGTVHFQNNVHFDDRIYLGSQTTLARLSDRVVIVGGDITEFVDDVIVDGDLTLNGRITGNDLVLDIGSGIKAYGALTEILQMTKDLRICAPHGIQTICGDTIVIDALNGMQLTGGVSNNVLFNNGITVHGSAFMDRLHLSGNLTLENLEVLHSLFADQGASVTGTLTVLGTSNTDILNVTTEAYFRFADIYATLTAHGAAVFLGPAMFHNGFFSSGGTSAINTDLFTVDTNNGTSLRTDGWLNATSGMGICLGRYNPTSTDPEEYCNILVRPGTAGSIVNGPVTVRESFSTLTGAVVNMETYTSNQHATRWFNATGDLGMCLGKYGNDPGDPKTYCSMYVNHDGCVSLPCIDASTVIANLPVANFESMNVTGRACLGRVNPGAPTWADSCVITLDNLTNTANVQNIVTASINATSITASHVTVGTDLSVLGSTHYTAEQQTLAPPGYASCSIRTGGARYTATGAPWNTGCPFVHDGDFVVTGKIVALGGMYYGLNASAPVQVPTDPAWEWQSAFLSTSLSPAGLGSNPVLQRIEELEDTVRRLSDMVASQQALIELLSKRVL